MLFPESSPLILCYFILNYILDLYVITFIYVFGTDQSSKKARLHDDILVFPRFKILTHPYT